MPTGHTRRVQAPRARPLGHGDAASAATGAIADGRAADVPVCVGARGGGRTAVRRA